MAGLRRTGRILVIALIPWMLTGCAGTGSRLTKWGGSTDESAEQAWARAQLCEKDGRFADAQQAYAELYRNDPDSARYAHRLGIVCTMLGDYDRARSAYNRASEIEPSNPELLADMGYTAYLQHNYAEAEQLLTASLALQAHNPRARSNLALAIGCQGRYDESLTLFREIHGQDEAEVLCNLAYVKAQCGEIEAAAGLYKQVLAIDPTVKKASAALAQLKASGASSPSVAGQKPYRKYMNLPAAPAQAKANPAAKIEVAAAVPAPALERDASASRPQVTQTANEVELSEPARQEAAAQKPDGWANTDSEIKPSRSALAFPTDAEPAGASDEQPVAKATSQTVTTEDSPFTVVEQPAEIGKVANDDDACQAFEEPRPLVIGWAATKAGLPEQFGPEWLKSRLEQIAARAGQTGFMGYCPVALREELRLVDALPQFTAEYQSQKYQFSSEEAVKQFRSHPERYLPAAGGLDVVAVSQGTAVAQGSLEHAMWFRHQLYLFMSRENMDAFRTQARQFAVQQ